MFYIYLLESTTDKYWYIGYTTQLRKRIRQHFSGQVHTTRNRRPLKLIYAEYYTNQRDALGREKFLKCGAGLRFLKKQLRRYVAER